MRFILASAAMASAFLAAVVLTTGADAAGLADMHTQVMVGNRVCFADHEHLGHGGRHASRAAAQRDAAAAWSGFTGLEYGAEWAQFGLAAGARMACDADAGGWSCRALARPCRAAGGPERPRMRRVRHHLR